MIGIYYFVIFLCLNILLNFIFLKKKLIADNISHRSAHKLKSSRAGGIVFFITYLPILFYEFIYEQEISIFYYLSLVIFLGVSVVDDFKNIPTRIKLFLYIIASFLFSYAVVGNFEFELFSILSLFGICFIILSFINFMNFMDGINGLVSLSFLLFASYLLVNIYLGPSENIIIFKIFVLCIFLLIFILFNIFSGKLFLGDAGSIGINILLMIYYFNMEKNFNPADLGFIADIFILLFIFSPLLIDAVFTIFGRIKKGENILSPHNQHLYQIFFQNGYKLRNIICIYLFPMLINILLVLFVKNIYLLMLINFVNIFIYLCFYFCNIKKLSKEN